MNTRYKSLSLKPVLLFILLSFFMGCATMDQPDPDLKPDPTQPRAERVPPKISLVDLKDILRMNRSKDDLGFKEEKFNECEVGVSNSRNSGCYDWHLTVINFQLLCRSSTGTVQSVSAEELKPIRHRNIRWRLGRIPGETQIDQEGYGQIVALTPSSPQQQRLRLTSGENFLRIAAASTRFIVVPSDWC